MTIFYIKDMNSTWFSNWCIYYDNLSFYYIFSIILSFLAVFVTWWFHKTDSMYLKSDDIEQKPEEKPQCHHGLLTQMKLARQEAIIQKLSEGLTEQQLQQEKETERAQLSAIFQLLSEQQDKFQVSSMEELHSQLRLYRTN